MGRLIYTIGKVVKNKGSGTGLHDDDAQKPKLWTSDLKVCLDALNVTREAIQKAEK